VADRVCQWRLALVNGDGAGAYLAQLAGATARAGRPAAGPRFPAASIRGALEAVEAERRAEAETWRTVRGALGGKATLLDVGAAWWRRVHGWDSDVMTAWERERGWSLPELTKDQLVMHLGGHLVVVRDVNDDRSRWVTIDDDGWPRGAAVALLAARWKVSKGWVVKAARPAREKNSELIPRR
jgi:hypothetical protein